MNQQYDLVKILTDPADSFKRRYGIDRCDACGRFIRVAPCRCGCRVVRFKVSKNTKRS